MKYAFFFTALSTALIAFSDLNAQLTADRQGKLDRSFGLNGLATMPGQVSPFGGNDTVTSSSGDLFLTYSFNGGTARNAIVMKQLSSGAIDTTFGDQGIKTIDLAGTQALSVGVETLALQADGKILVGGSLFRLGSVDGFVLRLTPTGELDKGFGTQGIITLDFTPSKSSLRSDDFVSKLVVDPDGKIVVVNAVGHFQTATGLLYCVLKRLNSDGSVDATFGTNGIAQQRVGECFGGTLYSEFADAQIQSDGKIIVGVTISRESTSSPGSFTRHALVLRYLSSGILDTGFSDDGIIEVSRFGPDLWKLQQLPDGKILVLISEGLVRLNADGTKDPTFGFGGHVGPPFVFNPNSFVITPDDKIIVSGWVYQIANGRYVALLGRYWPDGTADSKFGQGGRVQIESGQFFWLKALVPHGNKHLIAFCIVDQITPCSARIFSTRKP